MHTSAGPHRPFQVRAARKNGVEVDSSLIDTSAGRREMEFTELKDSRWERFNADIDEDSADQAQHFERKRIKTLQDEREKVQKKTFTKWVNSHLSRVRSKIADLYIDLRDGRNLIVLLEVLSGEKLPKAARGRMRIHCLENCEKVLSFLRLKKVKLENVGPADIVDGNTRLTLGLIWTIILRFQIQDIDIVDENKERRSAKDALLLWCQMKTADYDNVNIVNFTKSWNDGLGFNAIIHKHLPHLIDYPGLPGATDREATLENAFKVADEECGIDRLLDVEDVAVDYPDEKSIITYLAAYYHYFTKLKDQQLEGKRIGGVLDDIIATNKLQDQYENMVSDLLKWIDQKIAEMNDRNFSNSLPGLQSQWKDFEDYRKIEKPPKIEERGNLEVLLFEIQTKLREANRKAYVPKDGQLVKDVNSKWAKLEEAEFEREQALRDEIRRQKYLERAAQKFLSKVGLRAAWIAEAQKQATDEDFGNSLATINAALIRQNTLEVDIQAYEARIEDMSRLVAMLEQEKYYNFDALNSKKDDILSAWLQLQENANDRREKLLDLHKLYEILAECEELHENLDAINLALQRENHSVGNHLTECDELLQKHKLMLATIDTYASDLQKLKQAEKASEPQVASKIDFLENYIKETKQAGDLRSKVLEESKLLHKFNEDVEEHDVFIKQQNTIISNITIGHELTEIQNQLNSFDVLSQEIQAREDSVHDTINYGTSLTPKHYASKEITQRVAQLTKDWQELEYKCSLTKQQFDNTKQLYQLRADCQSLADQVISNRRQLENLEVSDIGLATALSKLASQSAKLEQIKSEVHDNIVAKKLPRLKKRVQECESEIATQEFLRVENEIEKFNHVLLEKEDDLNATKSLAQDLTLCSTTQEWCDEKLAILEQLQIPDQVDQVELVKRRVEAWEAEIEQMGPTMEELKQLPEKYGAGSGRNANNSANSNANERRELVESKVNGVVSSWARLGDELNNLKDKLVSKQSALEFGLNCDETITACDEKIRLAEGINEGQNADAGNLDLNSVMAVQKKLGALERDRDALKNRIKELENLGNDLAEKHPERAGEIQRKLNALKNAVAKLDDTLREKEAGLGAAGALHQFVAELSDLQEWVKSALQTLEDAPAPSTLQHCIELQNIHDTLRAEVDSYKPSIDRVCKTGRELVAGRPDEETMNGKLDELNDDFEKLDEKCDARSVDLDNASIELAFNAEAKQIEQLLDNKQVLMQNQLTHLPVYVQDAENSVRNQDAMSNALEAMHPRVNKLTQDASESTIPNQPAMADRAKEVDEKYNQVCAFGVDAKKILASNVKFARFNVDCAYFADWLKERKAVLKNQDEMTEAGSMVAESVNTGVSANDGMDLHIAFQKHQAFMHELQANQEKLKKINAEGTNLKTEIPHRAEDIEEKCKELNELWKKLYDDCQDREKRLFESRKAEVLAKNINELDNFTSGLNDRCAPLSEEDLGDLANVNRLLKNQELDEARLEFRKQELDGTADKMAKELTGEELADMEAKVEALRKKFDELEGPMSERRKELEKARDLHQLKRDIAEENRWIDEKNRSAESTNYGDSLHAVQVLQAKHDTLTAEVEGHEPRIQELLNKQPFIDEQQVLQGNWNDLNGKLKDRSERLDLSAVAQKYLFDADEARDWISERELCLLGQDTSATNDDEESAHRHRRRHLQHQAAINDYSDKIETLAHTVKSITEAENPDADICQNKQKSLEKAFASLKQLARERQAALAQKCEKLKLRQEFDEFQNWIDERERIANNSDTGRDSAHCQRLMDRFEGWANETHSVGKDKLDSCTKSAENVMQDQPSAIADIGEWKSTAEDSFQELMENIGNRKELLQASYERLKCLQDCQDATNQLNNKKSGMSKEIGNDAERTRQLLRQTENEQVESSALVDHAKKVDEQAEKLSERYAGDEGMKIQDHREALQKAIGGYQDAIKNRINKLKQVEATHDFNNFANDLLEWIEETNKKIDSQQRPTDKSQVLQLLTEHAAIKNDMEHREPEFQEVYRIEQSNVLDDESWQKIDSVIRELKDGFAGIESKWKNRNQYLLLAAEVTGYWADCAHADTWLKTHESENQPNETVNAKAALAELDQFETNILKPWNEKFKALNKLTKYEEQFKKQDEEDKAKEKLRLQKQAEKKRLEDQARELAQVRAEQQKQHKPKKSPVVTKSNEDDLPPPPVRKVSPPPENKRPAPAPPVVKQQTPAPVEVVEKPAVVVASPPDEPRDESTTGTLNRKAELGEGGKNSKNRSWNQLFVVLSGGKLMFFKDAQTASRGIQDGRYNSASRSTWKGEHPLDLLSCNVDVASDYTKRSNVFRLKLTNGAEYLFQATSQDEMNLWVQKFKQIQAELGGSALDDSQSQVDGSVSSQSTRKSKSLFSFGSKSKI